MAVSVSNPAELVACPQCDALYHAVALEAGQTAICPRCDTVLFAPRPWSIATVLALSTASLALMTVAISAPFLSLSARGLTSQASVLDAVEAFAQSDMTLLSLALGALILVLPVSRLLILIYVTLPLTLGRAPWPGARSAFRLNSMLRPWSMAEIFMLGVAVAMVKVSDLARLDLGTAFWAFGAVAILMAAKDALTCERTLWNAMARR